MMTYLFPGGRVSARSDEIIVDSFAGGGGASTGIEMALGRSPDIAINHDPEAVAMHTVNHPDTFHYCQNVWQVSPAEAAAGRPIGLAWFSPDCKHFSKAKGGKPVEKRIRDLAWVVVAWARLPAHIRPRVILLENVEEFVTWGPLAEDGRPCPERKGQEFKKWLGELKRLGYRVEFRELRACDYGAPTIRKRFFLIARCDGQPIVWPEPTHGAPDSADVLAGTRQPWRTAADIIDWSIPCPSIFLTKEEARALRVKRPLEEATMRRIFRGLDRYVIKAAKPFIVPVTHQGTDRCHDAAEPLRTVTTAKRGEFAVVTPYFQTYYGAKRPNEVRGAPADGLLGTQTTENRHALIMPYLAGCGGRAGQSPERSVETPTGTGTSKADVCLVAPFVTKFRNGSIGHEADSPLHTITSSHSDYHPGGAAPLGIVVPHLMTMRNAGKPYNEADAPTHTVTAGGAGLALVAPWMVQHNNDAKREGGVHPGRPAGDPLSTITASGSQQMVASAFLSQFHGTNDGNAGDVSAPLGTVLAQGFHHAEVRAFLVKYYGEGGTDAPVTEPLHTATAKARFGLVTVAGQEYQIIDIGMRMLTPRELFRAQGFSDDYVIEFEYAGRPLPKSSQVRMCGNSVCPPMAAALVRANVPDLARKMEAAE